MARPRKTVDSHCPTDEQRKLVRDLYAAGIPQDRIAFRIGISAPTLRVHYREDLDNCLDDMISGMVSNLYQDAVSGNEKAREFWLKTRGGLYYARPPEDDTKSKTEALLEKIIDKL